MPRDLAIITGAGVLSGFLYALIATGSPGALILAFLSPLPLFIVGLAFGAWPATLACAIAVLAAAIASLWVAVLALANALPIAWLIRQALISRIGPTGRQWYPPGLLATWLAGFAAVYFLLTIIAFSGADGGLHGEIGRLLSVTLGRFTPISGALPAEAVAAWAAAVPASAAGWWMIMITVNGLFAQSILSHFNRNLRPTPPLAEFDPPRLLMVVAGASLLLALLPDAVGFGAGTLAVIFLVPYFFVGLAVVHTFAVSWPARQLFLFLFYLLLVLLGWPVIAVAGLGIVEYWAKFRSRMAGTAPS